MLELANYPFVGRVICFGEFGYEVAGMNSFENSPGDVSFVQAVLIISKNND